VALVVAVAVAGLATFTDSVAKLLSLVPRQTPSAPVPIEFYLEIKNAGPNEVEIEPLVEFYLMENTGLTIREYPRGRARLKALDAPVALVSDYRLRGWNTRTYRFSLPEIEGYRELLERGAANIHYVVRLAGTRQFGMGSLPFQLDTLQTSKAFVEINQVP
jgi:hypothetical protein